jgi:hypothetical protein
MEHVSSSGSSKACGFLYSNLLQSTVHGFEGQGYVGPHDTTIGTLARRHTVGDGLWQWQESRGTGVESCGRIGAGVETTLHRGSANGHHGS